MIIVLILNKNKCGEKGRHEKNINIISVFISLIVSTFATANEVNIFNARHYKADAELYGKFTAATGIKVNLINGKSGALEKRMIEEGFRFRSGPLHHC